MNAMPRLRFLVAFALLLPALAFAQSQPRARELGVPFEGAPGTHNAAARSVHAPGHPTTLPSMPLP
jgi:hypothetical protein